MEFDESYDGPPDDSFPGYLVQKIEDSVAELNELGVRLVVLRTGIVLDKYQGAFPQLKVPFGWVGSLLGVDC